MPTTSKSRTITKLRGSRSLVSRRLPTYVPPGGRHARRGWLDHSRASRGVHRQLHHRVLGTVLRGHVPGQAVHRPRDQRADELAKTNGIRMQLHGRLSRSKAAGSAPGVWPESSDAVPPVNRHLNRESHHPAKHLVLHTLDDSEGTGSRTRFRGPQSCRADANGDSERQSRSAREISLGGWGEVLRARRDLRNVPA